MPFGQIVSVTGLGNGFVGTGSYLGDSGITVGKSVLTTAPNPVPFGAAVVIVPSADGVGDAMEAVSDFIASANVFYPEIFGGVAQAEVRNQSGTNIYPQNPETLYTGEYVQGSSGTVKQRGTISVTVNVGTPVPQAQVYLRTVANAAVPAGVVGGFEAAPAASDLFTLPVGTAAAASQAVIDFASTANVQVGQSVSGPGIPPGSVVKSFVAGTSVTLNNNLTAGLAAGTLVTFGNVVALNRVIFRSGVLGAQNQSDITMLDRVAA